MLLACYALLTELARAGGNCSEVIAWEQPWQRTYRHWKRRGLRRVRLPAAATLAWSSSDQLSQSYLLLPDLGGTCLATWQTRLLDLARLQQAYRENLPTLVIVTSSAVRATAWRQLLAEVAATNPDCQPDRWTIGIADSQTGLAVLKREGQPRRREDSRPEILLTWRDLELLDVLGRHPFLTPTLLARLLGQDDRSVTARVRRLLGGKFARIVPVAELGRAELASDHMLELTHRGMVAVAARLGLPPATAVRVHALTGGGPEAAFGPRQLLLAHAAHTQGADRVMVGLAAAARGDRRGGHLAEWRNATACAHGRLRPDAYGLLHLQGHDCGFFLEFDRATMRPAELRAKFFAYHRFRTSRRAARQYTSFPTVLVVTTEPGAEHRLARAVRAVDTSFASPLPVLLTTTAWIAAHARGMLGPIWRQPHAAARHCWPRLPTPEVDHAR
jgi:hypothetical protein